MHALAHQQERYLTMNKKNIFIYVLLAFTLSITLTVLSRINDNPGESLKGTTTTETSWLQLNTQP
jgi:hypothetical protein